LKGWFGAIEFSNVDPHLLITIWCNSQLKLGYFLKLEQLLQKAHATSDENSRIILEISGTYFRWQPNGIIPPGHISVLRFTTFPCCEPSELIRMPLATNDMAKKYDDRRTVQAGYRGEVLFGYEPLFEVWLDATSCKMSPQREFQTR
jgi:hypothetical protein